MCSTLDITSIVLLVIFEVDRLLPVILYLHEIVQGALLRRPLLLLYLPLLRVAFRRTVLRNLQKLVLLAELGVLGIIFVIIRVLGVCLLHVFLFELLLVLLLFLGLLVDVVVHAQVQEVLLFFDQPVDTLHPLIELALGPRPEVMVEPEHGLVPDLLPDHAHIGDPELVQVLGQEPIGVDRE